jgi:DNA-binding XRE family transcriptional regulator
MEEKDPYPVGVDSHEDRLAWEKKYGVTETRSLIKQVEDDESRDTSIQPLSPVNVMVGHKLALIRNTLGWSQTRLAEKVGLSRASIANIEGGRQKVDLDNLETFCIALGVTPHHFMKGIWFIDGRK